MKENIFTHMYMLIRFNLFSRNSSGIFNSATKLYGSVEQTFSSQFYYWASLVPSYHRPSHLKMTEQYPKKLQFFDHEKKFVFCKQKKSYRHTKHSKKKLGFCLFSIHNFLLNHIKPYQVEFKSLKISNMFRAEKDSLGFSRVTEFFVNSVAESS